MLTVYGRIFQFSAKAITRKDRCKCWLRLRFPTRIKNTFVMGPSWNMRIHSRPQSNLRYLSRTHSIISTSIQYIPVLPSLHYILTYSRVSVATGKKKNSRSTIVSPLYREKDSFSSTIFPFSLFVCVCLFVCS